MNSLEAFSLFINQYADARGISYFLPIVSFLCMAKVIHKSGIASSWLDEACNYGFQSSHGPAWCFVGRPTSEALVINFLHKQRHLIDFLYTNDQNNICQINKPTEGRAKIYDETTEQTGSRREASRLQQPLDMEQISDAVF